MRVSCRDWVSARIKRLKGRQMLAASAMQAHSRETLPVGRWSSPNSIYSHLVLEPKPLERLGLGTFQGRQPAASKVRVTIQPSSTTRRIQSRREWERAIRDLGPLRQKAGRRGPFLQETGSDRVPSDWGVGISSGSRLAWRHSQPKGGRGLWFLQTVGCEHPRALGQSSTQAGGNHSGITGS